MNRLTLSPKSVSKSVRQDMFPKEHVIINNITLFSLSLSNGYMCTVLSMTSFFFVSLPQCDTMLYWQHDVYVSSH